MRIVKISKADFSKGVGALQGAYRVFGPVKERNFHNFQKLEGGAQPDLDFQNTRLSAKGLIYAESEIMFEYSLDKTAEDHDVAKPVEKDYSPKAIVGIRPCDAQSFQLVKVNFDTPDYRDPYWVDSFECTTFVSLACDSPCATCFCTTANSGPHDEGGSDVLLIDRGDHYLAKVLTEKGEELAKKAGWETEAEEADTAGLEEAKKAADEKVTAKIDAAKIPEKRTVDLYDADLWEDLAFACINCGTCTYLCPTCWCFDIQDEVNGQKGIRMRNWDSCMYPLFTMHGTGHNPRPDKKSRVRQRFMHKLKYYAEKYGNGIHCVGCGRCIQQCPVNIDIRRAAKLMSEFEPGEACEVKA